MTNKKNSVKVKLRLKQISENRLSLYLDFYPPIKSLKTGKTTRREFLNKFIYAPISFKKKKTANGFEMVPVYPSKFKDSNEETLKLAEEIRSMRQNELNKPEIYNPFELEQLTKIENGEKNFVEYFKSLAEKRTGINHDNWIAASKYLERFTGGKKRFADLNEKFCTDFKDFLLTTKSNKSNKTTLAVNSAASYYNKFKAALRQAYSDGILSFNLNVKLKAIEQIDPQKSFLTIEELNKLIKTECNNPLLKKAALFSALTGLRFSDIQNLTWHKIEYSKDLGYYISFIQKKTGGPEEHQISEQAFLLLGDRGEPDEKVFEGLKYSAYSNKHLYQWIGAAGITKDITFHCFRHSYATLLSSKGVDLYVIMKLLGHKKIQTTQIYTQVTDKAKREAADRIHLDL